MTLSPTNSRWSSLVFLCALAFVSCIFISPFKKTSSRYFHFLSFLFCSAFCASNSLQIFQLIPCKSLWDLNCLVSWGDKCLLCNELGHTDLFPSVQRNLSAPPKHTTRCHRFHYRKDSLPLVSAFFLIQLHSMNLVLDQHHIQLTALFCDSRTKPIMIKIQKNPSWKLMSKGGERSHQSLIISIEGENTQGRV